MVLPFSSVKALFFSGSPANVTGHISFVVIDAINGKSWVRAFSNVGQKIREAVPSFTDCYSSTAVVLKNLGVFVVTSFSHSHPNFIKGVAFSVFAKAMTIASHAAAGMASFCLKRINPFEYSLAADAPTQPINISVLTSFFFSLRSNRSQIAEFLAGNVHCIGHRATPPIFVVYYSMGFRLW